MALAAAKERIICEFWSSAGESNGVNELAASIPLGLGLLIYAPMYVFKTFFIDSAIRYTLTGSSIRVDKGMSRKTIKTIPLDEIVDVRVVDYLPFTRTGNIELVGKLGVLYKMCGVQDPTPAAKTIEDAVQSRVQTEKVLLDQRTAKAAVAN